MKKIIYSLLFTGLVLTGCISYEEYNSEKLEDGPSIEISVSAVQDSSFVVAISPASGTKYYAYLVSKSDEAAEISAENLLKASYTGSKSVDAATSASLTLTIAADPHSTYQVYAVAANDKGVLGEVIHQTVSTTDGSTPRFQGFQTASHLVLVTFNEAIQRGTGNVSITYIKRYDLTNQETKVVDDEFIEVLGSNAIFEVPEPAPGVYFAISWAGSAFVDVAGNGVAALASGLTNTGQFVGIYGRIDTEPFAFDDESLVESPAYFADWTTFEAAWEFDFNIYPNSSAKKGDIQVVYSSSGKKTTVDVDPDSWTISGKSIKVRLPEAPTLGDEVAFIIHSEVFYDVYGNSNDTYEQETPAWIYELIDATFTPVSASNPSAPQKSSKAVRKPAGKLHPGNLQAKKIR